MSPDEMMALSAENLVTLDGQELLFLLRALDLQNVSLPARDTENYLRCRRLKGRLLAALPASLRARAEASA